MSPLSLGSSGAGWKRRRKKREHLLGEGTSPCLVCTDLIGSAGSRGVKDKLMWEAAVPGLSTSMAWSRKRRRMMCVRLARMVLAACRRSPLKPCLWVWSDFVGFNQAGILHFYNAG